MAGRRTLWLLLAVGQLSLWSLPASAGLFDDDEARNRIEGLRRDVVEQGKRLEAVTVNVTHATNAQLDLANQLEQLKTDVAKLRGQLEVLTYELDTAQKRQKDFYVDLDGRLRKLETEAADETPAAASTASTPPRDPAAEARDYEAGLTFFKAAKFKEAMNAFEGFIRAYPNSTLLPGAHYWAASAHYQLRAYAKAAELFGKVQANWPADAKAPEALLGQANSYREAGDAKAARRVLELLAGKYPNSTAGQTARARLQAK